MKAFVPKEGGETLEVMNVRCCPRFFILSIVPGIDIRKLSEADPLLFLDIKILAFGDLDLPFSKNRLGQLLARTDLLSLPAATRKTVINEPITTFFGYPFGFPHLSHPILDCVRPDTDPHTSLSQ